MFSDDPLEAFAERSGVLHCEDVSLAGIAREWGTPVYVYSLTAVLSRLAILQRALGRRDALVCYSVKANPHAALLAALARHGAGADVVSGGEMARALRSGFSPDRIVFAGVGKTDEEIAAALGHGIRAIHVESSEELRRVTALAALAGATASIGIRVNPDVDALTHRHLTTGIERSKFGVSPAEACEMLEEIARTSSVRCVGLHVHIGSQIADAAPFARVRGAIAPVLEAYRTRWGEPQVMDVGGGFGVRYHDETVQPLAPFARAVADAFADVGGLLLIEPGRSLVAEAGVLLTRLLYRKPSDAPAHYVVDAGMTDLLRPALYDAYHDVRLVDPQPRDARTIAVDVVGPVCESSDVIARGRSLPDVQSGALFAIMTAGAYGFAQSSTYNSRPRPAEVLVQGDRSAVIRARETLDDLVRGEIVPAFVR